jgi:hypothetical protein
MIKRMENLYSAVATASTVVDTAIKGRSRQEGVDKGDECGKDET